MYNEEPFNARPFHAISFVDEEPKVANGQLIPRGQFTFTPRQLALKGRPSYLALPARALVPLLLLALLMSASVGASWFWRGGGGQLASVIMTEATPPLVVIEHPYTKRQTPLNYGVEVAFSEPNFFLTARDAFITSGATFIEADLATMRLRYFEDGILVYEYGIVKKGLPGTFFETPAGLYTLDVKKKKHFSTIGQAYLPSSLAFQGNFYIHGTPVYETGEDATDFSGGIELADTDALELYERVDPGIPILVYEKPVEREEFLYEPKIPELATPHYLIADIESSTVLASSDLDIAVPIASLTKLMTAVVATEYINMDRRIAITQPNFVQSLVPRLGERSSVSMYSLLELLLLESSNEAADVIADEVGRAQFVAYMNERAKSLGMEHTTFTDPSGLDAGNVSSVGDLLRLTQYIYEKKRFIIDMSAGVPLPDLYVTGEFDNLSNFNDVAGMENFIGGKIGETSAAKQTSVTLHTLDVKGTERVVAIIILGSEGRNADVTALLSYASERFGD